jgi:mRNA interferase MazF
MGWVGGPIRRGEVYDARLDPVEGSEQGGTRPVVIVSRDAILRSSTVASITRLTTFHHNRKLYPSHVLIRAPEGGLTADSVALAEQARVLSKTRLLRLRGTLSQETMSRLARALRIALDLD